MADDFDDDLGTPTEEDLEKCYGGKYLNAADIGAKKIKTRIKKVTKETMQQQQGKGERAKFVLYLSTIDKPMVVNATNKDELVKELGRNPANWKNAEVGIYTIETTFGGKPTKGLRLRVLSVPKAAAAPKVAKPTKPAPAEEASWPEEEGDPGPEYTEAAE
jgi:hypothetical protein